jgi:small conductance mechanosensitive channel
MSDWITNFSWNALYAWLPDLVGAILILIIGWIFTGFIVRLLDRLMEKREMDISLRKFLHSLSAIALKILVVISAISTVGIETTSFVAVIGAAGLAIGLALQGSLANFAGGVLILIIKPFKVGDFIVANGEMGTVDRIQIFNTVLKTPDNVTVIIPNGGLANSTITNYSQEDKRRHDLIFGIGYGDDLKRAKEILSELLESDDRIHEDPEPVVYVDELADSSVNLRARFWCDAADYWDLNFEMRENVKIHFDSEGISIPFPQTDVHLFRDQ